MGAILGRKRSTTATCHECLASMFSKAMNVSNEKSSITYLVVTGNIAGLSFQLTLPSDLGHADQLESKQRVSATGHMITHKPSAQEHQRPRRPKRTK